MKYNIGDKFIDKSGNTRELKRYNSCNGEYYLNINGKSQDTCVPWSEWELDIWYKVPEPYEVPTKPKEEPKNPIYVVIDKLDAILTALEAPADRLIGDRIRHLEEVTAKLKEFK